MFDENLESLVDQFEKQIFSVRDGDEIESIAEKYKSLNHPQIGYRIGEKFLSINWKKDALVFLIKSASFGLNPENPYLSTGYGDSIAQSMWYILKYYDFNIEFKPYEYKIYCSAYMILSFMIDAMGNDAYNSLQTRAMMIDSLDKPCVTKMVSKYYYSLDDVCTEMLSYIDYHRASIGFLNVREIQNAQNCRNWAQNNLDKMLSLPQYKLMTIMPEHTIQKMSEENQLFLLNNMLVDYQEGAFKLSIFEFENAISNFQIKPQSGFGSWI